MSQARDITLPFSKGKFGCMLIIGLKIPSRISSEDPKLKKLMILGKGCQLIWHIQIFLAIVFGYERVYSTCTTNSCYTFNYISINASLKLKLIVSL